MTCLDEVLSTAGPVVLDGGLSTQLHTQGYAAFESSRSPLWTAAALIDSPDQIVAAHRAFARAGASILTTSSYQLTLESFQKAFPERRDSAHAVTELFQKSVLLARQAAQEVEAGDPTRRVVVAASLGSYGASLCDGSEYRGHYSVSDTTLEDFYRRRIEALMSAHPDILAFETVPEESEALVISGLVNRYQLPAWISFSVAQDSAGNVTTGAGQPLDSVFAKLSQSPGSDRLRLIGANCCYPDLILDAVIASASRSAPNKQLILYPNIGHDWDAVNRRWVLPTDPSMLYSDDRAIQLANNDNVKVIGGCCGCDATLIAQISDKLNKNRNVP